jgi:hypothetical protein
VRMRIRPARASDLDEVASIRQAAIARHRPGFERRGFGTRLLRRVEAKVERSTGDTEIHVNATRNRFVQA